MTTSPLMVETDLLSRLRAGDEDAFALFVRQYTGRMLALARGFLRNEDDAADAVQGRAYAGLFTFARFCPAVSTPAICAAIERRARSRVPKSPSIKKFQPTA